MLTSAMFTLAVNFGPLCIGTYCLSFQTVFGATRNGTIHAWDTRGGKASAAFQSHNEVHSADK